MLLGLLLTLNIIVCLALIGVVLLQRSEGGALGGGGSPTGLITSRGAGDLLTRITWILFSMFLILSLALTLLGGRQRSSEAILNRLKNESVNPDALARRTPAPTPGQTPPPVSAPAPAPSSTPSVPATTGGFLPPPKPVVSMPASATPPPTTPAKP
ncbi:MAG TPA: preprotein translocase subunit SecG [Caulobacteraceae bacterium]|jgi:preprotein translocase subunit SecG|nr:preprotein translocase subunit SecG [Caulobacteraceae bacterium]